jgi:predicted enzyme related to lactoylglutathione lyase
MIPRVAPPIDHGVSAIIDAMTSLVRHVTIDCADAYRLGAFWAGALGASLNDDDEPGDPEATVESPGATLLFVTVPDPKTVKNRVHLDLQPQDRTRDEEVERLLALGATLVGDHRRPDGTGWVTLADIEGNEFCVERSAAERG